MVVLFALVRCGAWLRLGRQLEAGKEKLARYSVAACRSGFQMSARPIYSGQRGQGEAGDARVVVSHGMDVVVMVMIYLHFPEPPPPLFSSAGGRCVNFVRLLHQIFAPARASCGIPFMQVAVIALFLPPAPRAFAHYPRVGHGRARQEPGG